MIRSEKLNFVNQKIASGQLHGVNISEKESTDSTVLMTGSIFLFIKALSVKIYILNKRENVTLLILVNMAEKRFFLFLIIFPVKWNI